MNLLKKLLYIVLLLILVAAIAIAALMYFIDPNKLKPVISQEVKNRTGYTLQIDGKLSWTIYPMIGVKAERMMLYAPQENKPMADLQDVTISTELSHLLRGQQRLSGRIYIAKVKWMDVNARRAHIGIEWQDQRLSLQPILASLYDGKLEGKVTGSDFSQLPRWSWDLNFKHIQVKPLMADVNGEDATITISGAADVSMTGDARGLSRQEVLQTLNGQANFSLNEGVLDGVDLNFLVNSAAALIDGKPVPQIDSANQTKFDGLTGTAVLRNGLARVDDLLLISPAFSTHGEGSVNLLANTIDYHLLVTPLAADRVKWSVPIELLGDLNKPRVRLDLTAINQGIAKEKFDKVKAKVQEQVKQLPEKADKFIKNLLGE